MNSFFSFSETYTTKIGGSNCVLLYFGGHVGGGGGEH